MVNCFQNSGHNGPTMETKEISLVQKLQLLDSVFHDQILPMVASVMEFGSAAAVGKLLFFASTDRNCFQKFILKEICASNRNSSYVKHPIGTLLENNCNRNTHLDPTHPVHIEEICELTNSKDLYWLPTKRYWICIAEECGTKWITFLAHLIYGVGMANSKAYFSSDQGVLSFNMEEMRWSIEWSSSMGAGWANWVVTTAPQFFIVAIVADRGTLSCFYKGTFMIPDKNKVFFLDYEALKEYGRTGRIY
ncbi:hypothetical protein SELMODRAFT_413378 [Selaginella moellendorffii]|uniref:Uncharacterized protein n=1 Tax=Selaginella moellendorffii TaxID=88036 RepID=D8RP94_SELML|nr:hypothetical protein SELMODRAFT_413378 [Selaginella moellendorffii]